MVRKNVKLEQEGPMPKFGELLRRLRGSRSQREVASDLGMPVTTLSTLENQSQIPRGSVIKRLADYYTVPLAYFYPSNSAEMVSTDSARQWLDIVRQRPVLKNDIATYASPDYPEEARKRFAEKIRQRKNADTSGRR
jgi:transcriptional regulator with XRE-family HTH domain